MRKNWDGSSAWPSVSGATATEEEIQRGIDAAMRGVIAGRRHSPVHPLIPGDVLKDALPVDQATRPQSFSQSGWLNAQPLANSPGIKTIDAMLPATASAH